MIDGPPAKPGRTTSAARRVTARRTDAEAGRGLECVALWGESAHAAPRTLEGMLLAIDTSSGSSVAVVDRDRGVIAEFGVEDTRRHAEVIGRLIADALDASGVPVARLSGVAVGMGPGPFTGLRVGIAAARAFALGAGKPVVPIASHDALAFAHFGGAVPDSSMPLLVATDARRRELYWTFYSGSDRFGLPLRAEGPGIATPAELPHGEVARVEASAVSAGSLGMLAELSYLHGRPFASSQPLYLRSPDVTLSSGPKRVTA